MHWISIILLNALHQVKIIPWRVSIISLRKNLSKEQKNTCLIIILWIWTWFYQLKTMKGNLINKISLLMIMFVTYADSINCVLQYTIHSVVNWNNYLTRDNNEYILHIYNLIHNFVPRNCIASYQKKTDIKYKALMTGLSNSWHVMGYWLPLQK